MMRNQRASFIFFPYKLYKFNVSNNFHFIFLLSDLILPTLNSPLALYSMKYKTVYFFLTSDSQNHFLAIWVWVEGKKTGFTFFTLIFFIFLSGFFRIKIKKKEHKKIVIMIILIFLFRILLLDIFFAYYTYITQRR